MPAKTKMAANKLPTSNFPRETSPTCAGASAVAGVADAAATTGAFAGAAGATAWAGALEGCDWATAGFSRVVGTAADDAGTAAAATGVSTTGEKLGAGEVGISSGLAGLPAASDPGAAPEDSLTALLAAASSGFGAVASIPAIAGAAVLVLASAALPFATAAPGMGLGSIAGLDSVCA